MTKFKKLKTVDSIFRIDDVSYEFNESVEYVFIQKNKLFFYLKSSLTEKQIQCVKSHIADYYYGYKCVFLKSI